MATGEQLTSQIELRRATSELRRQYKQMRSIPVVYLGGPITGTPFSTANEWRKDLALALESYGFRCLSPLRRYTGSTSSTDRGKPIRKLRERDGPSALQVLEDDLADIRQADYVLINFLNALYPSVGSLVELGYAAALGIPVIVILDPDDPHDHIFVTGLSLVVTSTDAAIAALVEANKKRQGNA